MPSREEIVERLIDGANEILYTYRHMPSKTRQALGIEATINKMKQRAAQVESMHCKTCVNFGG